MIRLVPSRGYDIIALQQLCAALLLTFVDHWGNPGNEKSLAQGSTAHGRWDEEAGQMDWFWKGVCWPPLLHGHCCLPGVSPSWSNNKLRYLPGHTRSIKGPAGAHATNQRRDGQADPLQLPQRRVRGFPWRTVVAVFGGALDLYLRLCI